MQSSWRCNHILLLSNMYLKFLQYVFKATFCGLTGHFTLLLNNLPLYGFKILLIRLPFWRAFWFFLVFGNYDSNCYKHICARFCMNMFVTHSGDYPGAQLLDHVGKVVFSFGRNHCTAIWCGFHFAFPLAENVSSILARSLCHQGFELLSFLLAVTLHS